MQEGNRILGIKKNIVTAMHKVMLIAILHSTFVAPCQGMYNDFFSDKNQLVYKGFSEMYSKTNADENDLLKTVVPVSNSVVSNRNIVPVVVKKTVVNPFKQRANYFVEADVKIGFIGVTKEQPMDNPADNLFKLIVDEFPVATSRVFLTYDLFGVQDLNGVSRSINQRLASGGYVVKQQNGWTSQKEEINQEWLKVGENQIMFTVPKGANFGYQIKNLKIEFEKVEENSLLTNIVLNSSGINFIKNNELYLKGFLRNNGVKVAQVFVDDHLINTNDGEFEGFVKLTDVTKNRKFIVIRAQNASGLFGQEIINLDNLLEADKIYPVEVTNEKVLMPVKAFEKATVEIDGGRLVLGDSALLVDKTIAITRLRAIDIAPLSSGMINVTKGGHGFRFLPEGTKFNKPVSIAIRYDEQLLPKGYSNKDIKTFYFNTNSKNWIAVKRDTISVEDRLIFAKTDHFTDYINGIIQAPESPETAGFTPTMMNDVKAADPSAEITIISPPEVSQKGDANISYPIKIPSGRKGMQPNLALQYSNEGGNGWAGLGWSMSTPAITIDSRWGVPELNNDFETVIYTLNGEQLMYQKIKNIDNSYSDWMPNRHYDASLNSTVYTTSARPRIVNAIFTPRKQGSFAKIERLGTSVDNYYWKVTGTDGTVNWFGGDETGLNNNAIIKNDSGAIVHWGMTKTIDVYFNNVIYIYDNYIIPNSNDANENLNGGRVFNIKNIYYTGTKTTNGEYSVTFETDNSSIREDVGLNARLGLKQVEPYRLNKIIVSLKAVPIRSYRLNYLKGAFGKYLLSDVSEYEGNNSNSKEFYKHVFDYYDNVTDKKRGSNVPITISSVPYDVPINVAPDFSFGIDLLNPSITNANETFQWEWGVRPAAGIDFPDSSDDPASLLTIGAPFGESYSKSRGKVTMSDMNGDGLDDVVYRSGDDLKYMPHLKDNDGKDIFGSEKSIFNINNFYRNIGLTKTVFGDSWDVSLFWDGYFGTKRFKTFADTDIYFTDGNGDGLPDIVNDSKVYFNKLESNGDITYGTSSQPTPNMLITADTNFIDATRVPDKDPIKDYLYDVVRVWEAPREGIIGINDNVIFMPVTAQDKLTYSIETQLGNNCQPFRVYLKEFTNTITTDNLAITNYNGNNPALGYPTVSSCNPQTNLTGMHVYEGQKIYFREHKTRVGNNEELKTNPEIYYIQGANNPYPTIETDANNINLNSIKHDESFILSESQSAEVKNTGTYKINWNPINVTNLTDAVTYKIVRTETAPGVLPIKTIVYEKIVSQGTSILVTPATNSIVGQNISNIIVSNIPGRHKIFYNFYHCRPKV
jgi:hypothetical protein